MCEFYDINSILDSINRLCLSGVNIFILSGEVGAGKTYLVKTFAIQKGIKSVTSPTFSFIHEYFIESNGVQFKIFHYDLYLNDTPENRARLLESLCENGLHFVEWGDENLAKDLKNLGLNTAFIKITESKNNRTYSLKS